MYTKFAFPHFEVLEGAGFKKCQNDILCVNLGMDDSLKRL